MSNKSKALVRQREEACPQMNQLKMIWQCAGRLQIKDLVTAVIVQAAIMVTIVFVISQCDLFIGSRMHSCIAALSTCTPVVAMVNSGKFNGIWEQYGLREYMIDLRFNR